MLEVWQIYGEILEANNSWKGDQTFCEPKAKNRRFPPPPPPKKKKNLLKKFKNLNQKKKFTRKKKKRIKFYEK